MAMHALVVALGVTRMVQQERWLPELSLDFLELVESATYVMERGGFVTHTETRGLF